MRKPRKKKASNYTWSGTFTKKPAATCVSGSIWAVKHPTERTVSYVDIETLTCSSCEAGECRHVAMAIAQRRHIIHRGFAERNGSAIVIPDANTLAISEIMRAYRTSRRLQRKGASHG